MLFTQSISDQFWRNYRINWFSSFSTFWNFCPNVKVWGYNLQCSKDISSVDPCLSIHHHIISNSQRFYGFTWLSTGCVYLLLRIWMRSRCVTSHLYEVYWRVLATSHTGFWHRWGTRGTRKMVKPFFLVQQQ